jgi:hypothetical protein
MKQLARHLYEIINSATNFSTWIFLERDRLPCRSSTELESARASKQAALVAQLAGHHMRCH